MFVTIVMIITAISFVWLIIYGGSMNKSAEEQKLEDEEQIKYIEEYNKKRQNKKSY